MGWYVADYSMDRINNHCSMVRVLWCVVIFFMWIYDAILEEAKGGWK